jgi:hypothetical protein
MATLGWRMKQAEISEIKRLIESLSRDSWLGADLKQVDVEPSEDGLGGDFLRVDLHVGHPERVEWKNVAGLIRSIEDAVLDIDDRFPSVHFPDAA